MYFYSGLPHADRYSDSPLTSSGPPETNEYYIEILLAVAQRYDSAAAAVISLLLFCFLLLLQSSLTPGGTVTSFVVPFIVFFAKDLVWIIYDIYSLNNAARHRHYSLNERIGMASSLSSLVWSFGEVLTCILLVLKLTDCCNTPLTYSQVFIPVWIALALDLIIAIRLQPLQLMYYSPIIFNRYSTNLNWIGLSNSLIDILLFGLQLLLIALKLDNVILSSWRIILIPSVIVSIFGQVLAVGFYSILAFVKETLSAEVKTHVLTIVIAYSTRLFIVASCFLTFSIQVSDNPAPSLGNVFKPLYVLLIISFVSIPITKYIINSYKEAIIAAHQAYPNLNLQSLSNKHWLLCENESLYRVLAKKELAQLIEQLPHNDQPEHVLDSFNDNIISEISSSVTPPRHCDIGHNSCVICLKDKEVAGVLHRCGHAVTCWPCTLTLIDQYKQRSCPICRSDVQCICKNDTKKLRSLGDSKQIIQIDEGFKVSCSITV